MTVIIAGGGIGGLTLALSLHQIGIKAQIFESVAELRPLGVGINVLPHAARELIELGLEDRLAATAVPTAELAYFSKHGIPVWSEPRGRLAGYNWPQFSIQRGRLQMLLLDAVHERLGADAIYFDHHLASWEGAEGTVRAKFANRNGGNERVYEGRVLVAADGIHSAARQHLFPEEGPPVWDGAILWRGVTVATPFLSGRTMAMLGHSHQKFVTYPIEEPASDGTQLINWIAEIKYDQNQAWNREDWNRPGNMEDFLPAFSDWRYDWLDVPKLIEGAEHVYEYPMVDRDPLPQWTHGAMTLLGDAAHPMYPIGSNGASQAILDARVLAREFQAHGVGTAAFTAYEDERRLATARIVTANRDSGPDEVLDLIENRAPDGFADLDAIAPHAERAAIAHKYKALAGFDVETLNARPAIVGS